MCHAGCPSSEPTSAIVAVILPVANRDTLNIRGGIFQSGGHLDVELLALICRTGESSRGRFELRGGGKERFKHRPNCLLEFGYKAKTVGPALIGSRSIPFGYCIEIGPPLLTRSQLELLNRFSHVPKLRISTMPMLITFGGSPSG
ncbi:hypothetical protein IVB56_25215 [Bradyrhizobium sp. CW7]|uniref:hypothetical protein n=1 Tax=Bradyrhizobium sp. CW7 TaxID=2782688 RepID=UPI001FFB5FD6|nr:hypothetical protein [Bradyrhizobium sp. CW7]MCK1354263.1 hypothetical protein [Bradyrhizobium sp. CW7]